MKITDFSAEDVAKMFHRQYEELAPRFGYKTRKASSVPWGKVPKKNRDLMIAVAGMVMAEIRIRMRVY
jgi:hypothetical protein